MGLEPTISAGERSQTHALDRADTGTGHVLPDSKQYFFISHTIGPTELHHSQHHISKLPSYFWSIFQTAQLPAPYKALPHIQQFTSLFLKLSLVCCWQKSSWSRPYPCANDIILHNNPTNALSMLALIYSHCYTATGFIPHGANRRRKYWYISWAVSAK